jgi:hypothetical protein
MSRDRYYDDESSPGRGRYADYDDDYYGDQAYFRPQRSGAVTGVAIANFVFGGLVILFGLCGFLAALVEASEGWRPGGGLTGAGFAVFLVIDLFVLIWAIGAIVAGVGVINRRQWGRVLALILGGIAGVKSLLAIFLMFMIMGSPARGPFDDDRFLGLMVLFMLALLYLGYCIWTYVVLLSSRYSAEFG